MIAYATAFDGNWPADVTRLLLVIVSMFLVLLCARVAWLRARSPKGHKLRGYSPWALLSYAGLCFIPTVRGFRNFGDPLDPLLTAVFAGSLAAGLFAAFGQVTIRMWTHDPTDDEEDNEEDEER